MTEFITKQSDCRVFLEELYPLLCAVNRQDELHRLITWAEEQQATKALHLYEARLRDVNRQIRYYRTKHLSLVFAAYTIHSIVTHIIPRPTTIRKGAASEYRFVKVHRRQKPKVC